MSSLLLALLLAGAPDAAPAPAAAPAPKKDKLIYRPPHKIIGSRIAQGKVCRTAAEWQAYRADSEQMRRDLGNIPCRPGAGSC